MNSQYPGTCKVNPAHKWVVGTEIFYQKEPKAICSDKVCFDLQVGSTKQATFSDAPAGTGSLDDAVNAVTVYAEIVKSIGVPMEQWNLSTVWNTERLRRTK